MLTYSFEDLSQDPKTLSPPVTGPRVNHSDAPVQAETERPSRSSTPTSLKADGLLHSGTVCLTGKKHKHISCQINVVEYNFF